MEKPGYGWVLKWLLAAILIGVGLYMFFDNKAVFLVTGIVIVIFSVFRVRSLIKTLNTEKQRTLNLIEIVLSTLVGIVLIVVAAKSIQDGEDISNFWIWVYRWSLVFFFGARAIIYFYSITFLDEKSEQVKFWAHILLLPVATLIVTKEDFSPEWVGMLLLIISLIGGAYLAYDGGKGYRKYRNYQQLINPKVKDKEKVEQKDVPLELPDRSEDEERPYIS